VSKKVWLVILGLNAYLAFTITQFPAAIAYRWFAPPDLSLAGVEGTIWSAQIRSGSVGQFSFENLKWELHPSQLFLLRLAGELEADFLGGFVNTRISFSGNETKLTSLRGGTTIAALKNVLPIRGTKGQINLALEEVSFVDGWPVYALGIVNLENVAVPPLVPMGNDDLIQLGNHRINFNEVLGGGLGGVFSDQGGPIEASGSWTLDLNQSFLIQGILQARPSADAALIQGINFMTGEPDAAGNRKFSFAGSL
jgi:hypothetical protein